MAIAVTPVRGFAQRRAFIDLPYRLHAGTPWIPALKIERWAYFSRHLHPLFKRGDAEYFAAWDGDRIVGRITAQVDYEFNRHHNERWGRFGFLEFEDDPEILAALLAAARAWLGRKAVTRIVGPMDLEGWDEMGILYDGFEHEPMIRQPWHPPYYHQRLEELGAVKAMDVYHWDVRLSDRDDRMNPILERLAARCRSKYGIEIRKMTRRSLRSDLDEFAKVYNAAWSTNWGFVPLNEHDLDDLAISYQLVFNSDWFMIAENPEGETVAAAVTIPDINQVLKKMKGRVLPFGWFHYLRRERIITRNRVGFLGVLPEYQHTGVAAELYIEHFDRAAATRITNGDAGWILENNKGMNRGLEAMGARITKRARMYDLPL